MRRASHEIRYKIASVTIKKGTVMAITYRKGASSLVAELQQEGFEIDAVVKTEGAPERGAQIFLRGGTVVNWDRDSRSIWAEGPWPESERVEASLRAMYEKNWLLRLGGKLRRFTSPQRAA